MSRSVVIVGAGLAGLSAARSLVANATEPIAITIIERDHRIGGRIETVLLDGVAVELGACFAIQSDLVGDIVDHPSDTIALFAGGRTHTAATVTACLTEYAGALDPADPAAGPPADLARRLLTFSTPFAGLSPRTDGDASGPQRAPAYGDLSRFETPVRSALSAFFGVIHPGRIEEYLPILRPTAVENWPATAHRHGNASVIDAIVDELTAAGVMITTGVEVVAIAAHDDRVAVSLADGGSLSADAVIVATTPRALSTLVGDLSERHRDLYGSVTYEPGIAIGLSGTAGTVDLRFGVALDEVWNTIITGVHDSAMTAQVYLSGANALEHWALDDDALVELVAESLRHLGIVDSVGASAVRRWREVGPVIGLDMARHWFEGHHRIDERVFFAGEVATFGPNSLLCFGAAAATSAGETAAAEVLALIEAPATPRTIATREPLITAHLYRLGDTRPIAEQSRLEGDVAFYGLINRADPDPELAAYLWEMRAADGLWEYQRGFNSTLEDSCLVIEGLVDHDPNGRLVDAVALLVERHCDVDTGIFHTTRAGRADYWRDPSVDGTAWAAWLAHRLDPQRWGALARRSAEWLWSQRMSDGRWRGTWFAQRELTDYLVIRALVATDAITPADLHDVTLRFVGSQRLDGSWSSSVISTSTRMLSLAEIADHLAGRRDLPGVGFGPVGSDEFNSAIGRGRQWIESARHGETWPGEPILYYWFETDTGYLPGERQFFHCHDRGAITTAWARLALGCSAHTV